MQELYKQLKTFGHVRLNELLAKHTTFKIGGPADFFIEISEIDKLVGLLNFLIGEGISYYLLGGGSNMLFSDEGFRGVVIKVKTVNYRLLSVDTIVADAGVLLSAVVGEALKNGLAGMEWASGIPGTIGGAVRGNAGAMGHETGNVVDKVEVWQDGEIVEYTNDECNFSYRSSVFKGSGGVVLRTWFKLIPRDKKEILAEMQTYLKQRGGRYPTDPNAGSFFQNIPVTDWPGKIEDLPELFRERGKVPVGWLVEQLNLKGFTIGGAKVSAEHGNFIVNFNNATQADILTVVEAVKEKVYNKFKVELKSEVEIV